MSSSWSMGARSAIVGSEAFLRRGGCFYVAAAGVRAPGAAQRYWPRRALAAGCAVASRGVSRRLSDVVSEALAKAMRVRASVITRRSLCLKRCLPNPHAGLASCHDMASGTEQK